MTLSEAYSEALKRRTHAIEEGYKYRALADEAEDEGMRFEKMQDWESADEQYHLCDEYMDAYRECSDEEDRTDQLIDALQVMRDTAREFDLTITIEGLA